MTAGSAIRYEAFARGFALHGNATKAAEDAGYSKRSAHVTGARLIRNAKVSALIDSHREALAATATAKAEDVLRELAILLTSDVRHFTVDDSGELTLTKGAPEHAWRAVASVKHTIRRRDDEVTRTIEFRLWPKTDAARMLGEHFKLYTQKVEHEVPAGTGVLAVPVPVSDAQWATAAANQQAALLKRPPSASQAM